MATAKTWHVPKSWPTPTESRSHLGGIQHVFKFPNGHGASVVRNQYSYGGAEGKWELAVLDSNGHLDYSTPITSDVLGHLSVTEVAATLDAIAGL